MENVQKRETVDVLKELATRIGNLTKFNKDTYENAIEDAINQVYILIDEQIELEKKINKQNEFQEQMDRFLQKV